MQRASGVPHALFGRKIQQSLGRIAPRGRECVFGVQRHCEPTGRANARPMTGSAKQSILSLRGTMDCFAPLAMTVFVRGAVASQFRLRHSGMRRQAQTRNLEIPGSMLRIAPE